MRRLIPTAAAVFVAVSAMSFAQCRKAPPSESAAPDYALVGTVHDIMKGIVDPASDVLFDAVATEITAAGVNEKRPQTAEDWALIEGNALMLAEAANLLKMPGRKAASPGDQTKSEGPDAPELSPEEIQAKMDADRAKWVMYANRMQEQANKARDAAKRRDVEGLFALGEYIDVTCEECHLEYWYPNDTAARQIYEQAKADRERAEKQQQP